MCHGSRKMNDAINHITYVEPKETMMVKNCLFVNSSENVKSWSLTSCWIDLTVTNTAAKARYIMIPIQKYTMVM